MVDSSIVEFPPDLVEDAALGRIVYFVGAGASLAAENFDPKSQLLGWPEFLTAAASLLENAVEKVFVLKLVAEADFVLAAEALKTFLRDEWISAIERCFNPPKIRPSQIHFSLVESSARLIVTTNFGQLLERAANQRESCGIQGMTTLLDQNLMKKLRTSDRYIVKLHGCVTRPETLIFTKTEYDAAAYKNDHYFKYMESLLINFTILFVGTSLRDPIINLLIDSVNARYPTLRPHYVFSKSAADSHENLFRFQKRNLRLLQFGVDGSGYADLPKKIDRLSALAAQRRLELLSEVLASPRPTTS